MKRTILLVLICACALVTSLVPARAYDDDTDYYYCYYLARKCGFGKDDALKIASANVAVDYCPVTEPLQGGSPGAAAQVVRERFHSLPELGVQSRPTWSKTDLENVREWLKKREDQAWTTQNPGMFLHYYMDMFAHRDFHSVYGHGIPPWGHRPDYLSYDVAKAMRMTRGVITILLEFQTHNRLPVMGVPGLDSTIVPAFPAASGLNEKREAAYTEALKVLTKLTRNVNKSPELLNSPNSAAARQVVEEELNEKIPGIDVNVGGPGDHRIDYQFDLDGNVTSFKDQWALTG